MPDLHQTIECFLQSVRPFIHNLEDEKRIKKEKKDLEALGYDCYMIFVNTSLEVAKQRNKERTRRLPEDILVQSWKDVQKNLGAFQSLFGSNFVIVDNSDR